MHYPSSAVTEPKTKHQPACVRAWIGKRANGGGRCEAGQRDMQDDTKLHLQLRCILSGITMMSFTNFLDLEHIPKEADVKSTISLNIYLTFFMME